MKLKDIADMAEYLENRCYCPNEIYDLSGFFFDIFTPDTECLYIAKYNYDFVVACGSYDKRPQILLIACEDGKVSDCARVDATEHNIEEVRKFVTGESEIMTFDEYEKDSAGKSELMDFADAIMI